MPAKIVLERGVQLQDSMIWQTQKSYYQQEGVNAWQDDVPCYITSNPFIATQYAEAIMAVCLANDDSMPVPIIELGAGSGKFSFHCLAALRQLEQQAGANLNFCYYLSDFSDVCHDFWLEHGIIKEEYQRGRVKFLCLDCLAPEPPTDTPWLAPMVVIANYLFDSLPQAVYEVVDGQVFALTMTTTTEPENLQDERVLDWEKVHLAFDRSDEKIENTYQPLLEHYANTLAQSYVLIPVAAITLLRQLGAWSEQGLLLLSADKGFSTNYELDYLDCPLLTHHGAVSMMVNFHAVATWISQAGGAALLPDSHNSLKVIAAYSGAFPTSAMIQLAIQRLTTGFTVADYFQYYEALPARLEQASLPELNAFLKLSQADAWVLHLMHKALLRELKQADGNDKQQLQAILSRSLQHVYVMVGLPDSYFEIGVLYQAMGCYTNALGCYELSRQYFGRYYNLDYNMAVCFFYLKNYPQAVLAFDQLVQSYPERDELHHWCERLKPFS